MAILHIQGKGKYLISGVIFSRFGSSVISNKPIVFGIRGSDSETFRFFLPSVLAPAYSFKRLSRVNAYPSGDHAWELSCAVRERSWDWEGGNQEH